MALQYRKRVQRLYVALQDEEEEKRVEAADILRSLEHVLRWMNRL
ncbi:hypothetical protein [Aquamicrobium sp.]|nr:hypothetical protein [Aquamicrobium sp.]